MYTVQIYCSFASCINITDDMQTHLALQKLSTDSKSPKVLTFASEKALTISCDDSRFFSNLFGPATKPNINIMITFLPDLPYYDVSC